MFLILGCDGSGTGTLELSIKDFVITDVYVCDGRSIGVISVELVGVLLV